MKKIVLTFGLICGVIMSVLMCSATLLAHKIEAAKQSGE